MSLCPFSFSATNTRSCTDECAVYDDERRCCSLKQREEKPRIVHEMLRDADLQALSAMFP